MLLFDYKQYLQSYDTKLLEITEIQYDLLQLWQFNAYKNSWLGLEQDTSRVCDVTTLINPAPCSKGGMARLHGFREEEELLLCRQN